MIRTDDPDAVRRQYASEDGLLARSSIYGSTGSDARDVIIEEVAGSRARTVLDVGCGWGDLARRLGDELGVVVTAIDLSARMVELACERGVDAQMADVQSLPFEDASFDAVVAAWMLYHVPDLDLGLAEIRRVLRPGGTLVASTNAVDDMAELWRLVGRDLRPRATTFRMENGHRLLAPHFTAIRRVDVVTEVSFATAQSVRDYVGSTEHGRILLANLTLDIRFPLVATKRIGVFRATVRA